MRCTPVTFNVSKFVARIPFSMGEYDLFLEEKLECFRVLKYDIEATCLSKQGQGPEMGHSRTMELNSQDVLEQLTALQQLLYRLIDCRTGGVANNNYQVQYALAQALKESFKIYCAINDGIINLIDKFFEMPKHAALKALDVYKRAVQQAGNLSHFYESCQGLELARNFQFPTLREIGTGGSFFGPLFVHAHPEIDPEAAQCAKG